VPVWVVSVDKGMGAHFEGLEVGLNSIGIEQSCQEAKNKSDSKKKVRFPWIRVKEKMKSNPKEEEDQT